MELGASSESARRELRLTCKKDLLFWCNVFGWTYDPRESSPHIPFIAWPFQEVLLQQLDAAITTGDVCIRKSRDMGVSWCTLMVFLRRTQFELGQTFGVVSRNADYVDAKADPKSLFWKLDYLLERQPQWLRGTWVRNLMHLVCKETGSGIHGESTTGKVARGARLTALLLDEFSAFEIPDGYAALASTEAATKCRIINGTPQGSVGAYRDVANGNLAPGIEKITVHWTQHPLKAKGLYKSKDGVLEILDKTYRFPTDYKFVLDGKTRSPEYDLAESRSPVAFFMAQEWDISFAGSQAGFFTSGSGEKRLAELETSTGRPPDAVGELEYHTESLTPVNFIPMLDGRLSLWVQLHDGKPLPGKQYVMGCDVAAGTGASNSVISVVDSANGEKVAEWVSANTDSHEMARVTVALARWFNEAYLVWEAIGPGYGYGKVILDEGYRNIYFRREEVTVVKRITQQPGVWPTPKVKYALLESYRQALWDGMFINRSRDAIRECREYIYLSDGRIVHSRSLATLDPSGAKDNHGDRVIADALAWLGYRDRPGPKAGQAESTTEGTYPVNSFGWRQEQERQEARASKTAMCF